MSNALAIATVTATIQRLLQNAMDAPGPGTVPGVHVRPMRPGAPGASGPDAKGLNLYLYEVVHNAALRNYDLPTRSAGGRVMQRPRCALDLHYLITFYGDDTQFETHRMLAIVASTIHANATLTRADMRDTIADPTFNTILAQSDLPDDIDVVRLTPIVLSLEELSKLWSVLLQVPQALGVAYQASVVLLESPDMPQTVPPARRSNFYFGPAQAPRVDSLDPLIAVVGDLLALGGDHLKGDTTTVTIGSLTSLTPSSVTDTEVELTVPSNVRAGIQPVSVVRSNTLSSSSAPARAFTRESNVVALVVAPQIGGPAHRSVVQGNTLTLALSPPVGNDQTATLILGDRSVVRPANPLDTTTTTSVTFTVPSDLLPSGIDAVDLPLLVQVDGATSPLVDDTSAGSPGYAPSLHVTRT